MTRPLITPWHDGSYYSGFVAAPYCWVWYICFDISLLVGSFSGVPYNVHIVLVYMVYGIMSNRFILKTNGAVKVNVVCVYV